MSDLIQQIGRELHTQDNRATSDPIWEVQEKVIIHGLDPDYAVDYVWFDPENLCEVEESELKEFGNPEDHPTWRKVYYKEEWRAVQWFFTEKAAQDYIKRFSYKHTGELRDYVNWLGYNEEMKALRNWMMQQTKTELAKKGAPTDG